MCRTFKLTKEDLIRTVYFTLCKYKLDPAHGQGTSVKRDLLGGFLDRWINRVSEYVVFNHLLEDKPYSVVPDYYLYSGDSEKNAPDVLGLIDNTTQSIIKFVKYVDGTWVPCKSMPFIEIKNIRKTQWLGGVRQSQMDDAHYYLFVESAIADDYLTSLFSQDLLSEEVLNSIKMDRSFIESDAANGILEPLLIEPCQDLGTLRLLGIYKGSEVKRYAKLCPRGENPHYVRKVEAVTRVIRPSVISSYAAGKHKVELPTMQKRRRGELIDVRFLPLYFDLNDELQILGQLLGSVNIKSSGSNNRLMNYPIPEGLSKIILAEFERSSSWDEYIVDKSVIDAEANDYLAERPNDKTDELIALFDKLCADVE